MRLTTHQKTRSNTPGNSHSRFVSTTLVKFPSARFWDSQKPRLSTVLQTNTKKPACPDVAGTKETSNDLSTSSRYGGRTGNAIAALSLSAVLFASGCVFDKSGLPPWEAGAFSDSSVDSISVDSIRDVTPDLGSFDSGSRDRMINDIRADSKVKPPLEFSVLGEGGMKDGNLPDAGLTDQAKPDIVLSKDQLAPDQTVSDKSITTDQSTKSDQSSVCHNCSSTVSSGKILPDIPLGTTVTGVSLTNGVTMTYIAGTITNFTMTVKFTVDQTCAGTISVSKSSLTLSMNATPFGSNTQSVTITDTGAGKNIKVEFSATNTGKGMQLTYRVSGC